MENEILLTHGSDVVDVNGDALGRLVDVERDFLVVEKGFFFPTDRLVPVSAIATYNEQKVHLTLTKDEVLGESVERTQSVPATGVPEAQQADPTATWPRTGGERQRIDDDVLRIPVHEEKLDVSRRVAEAGEVIVSKEVVTETERIDVPVTEERVRIEWRTPTGEIGEDGEEIFEEGVFEVPVTREEIDVRKRVVQAGEVEISKEEVELVERATETIRKEVVEIDERGVQKRDQPE
jgi:uncharacterized protein (TIGR02271 family)